MGTRVPTPVIQGSMSPNEQAITLLAGFASGSVTMVGDMVKHIPTIPEGSITQTLNEVWGTPKQKKIPVAAQFVLKSLKLPKKSLKRPLPGDWLKKNPIQKFQTQKLD